MTLFEAMQFHRIYLTPKDLVDFLQEHAICWTVAEAHEFLQDQN
jgi:hypothetical protein